MSKRVRLGGEAREELRAAVAWYEAQRPGLGQEFFHAVSRAIDEIADGPERYAAVAGVPKQFTVRRVLLHRFPYAVVFVDHPKEVRVIAVAHGKRRPGYWRKRLKP